MQVRQITGANFMRYGAFKVTLPERGLVLVTGENGAGKSALIEAISYACWGKTLRGTDPRREGEAGFLKVEGTGKFPVERRWHGHPFKNSLTMGAQVYDTVTKAQEHVTEVLGEWDTWRRSCAFSSQDDLGFASATDAERKRLLENLIGLQRFDVALERARAEAKLVDAQARDVGMALITAEANKAAAERSLTSLEAVSATVAPEDNLPGLVARLETLRSMLPDRTKSVGQHEDTMRSQNNNRAVWAEKVNHLKRELKSAADSTTCPTCGQDWPDEDIDGRMKAIAALKVQLQELLDQEPGPVDRRAYDHAIEQQRACQTGISELSMRLKTAERAAQRHAEALALVKQARVDLLDLDDAVDAARAALEIHTKQSGHLTAVTSVLGTRGARAHMLAEALTGLEQTANLWLDLIARSDAPLSLKLQPYTEKKAGGMSESISLEVIGAGGGLGYPAASGGEKRRIDVALMLALAEIAQAGLGTTGPTMLMDEVFDALDTAGVEAVSAALVELAKDRCVIVVSHNPDLINHVSPTLRLHVKDGVIS